MLKIFVCPNSAKNR